MSVERSWVSNRDRVSAMIGVVAVHLAVLFALLNLGGGPSAVLPTADPLQVFDVDPPQPLPPPPKAIEAKRSPEKEGAAAPPAKKAEATPVVRPKPVVTLPPLTPPITAAEKPGEGAAPKQGAAPVDGPGSGAGGIGFGTGSGSGGTGSGGGGTGGSGQRPALVSRPLSQRDYSPEAREAWPSGKRVLVIFNVQLNGRATDCRVYQSIGVAAIDAETCALVTRKLRFRPARDERGRPYVERYAYAQVALF